jgi:hypothetical protein
MRRIEMLKKILLGLVIFSLISSISSIVIADKIDFYLEMNITPNMGGWPTLSYSPTQTQVMGTAFGESIIFTNNPNPSYSKYNFGTGLSLMETGITQVSESQLKIFAHLIGTASGGNLSQNATTDAVLSLSYLGDSSCYPGQVPGGYAYDMNGTYTYTIKLIEDTGPSLENTSWKFNFNSQSITLNLPTGALESSGSGSIGIQFIGGWGYDEVTGQGTGGGSGSIHFNIEQAGQSAVPLPGAVLLLGAGLGRLALYRRRKLTAKN